MSAYFNSQLLPEPSQEYVCFLDIMGIQSRMKKGCLAKCGNFIFKLHATILEAWRTSGYKSVSVYPIMDGAYITSKNLGELLDLLTDIYSYCAEALLATGDVFEHWYLIRGAVAYGSVIHGRSIPYEASLEFASRVGYKEQLLIGAPMIHAFAGEGRAAPMGIYLDETATGKQCCKNWKWFNHCETRPDADTLNGLRQKLVQYYDWLETHADPEDYAREKREEHLRRIKAYFEIPEHAPEPVCSL